MAKNRIHVATFDADSNSWEWVDYSVKDFVWLLSKEVIDVDQLGYAMNDREAFEIALSSYGAWDYETMINTYLKYTTTDIWL